MEAQPTLIHTTSIPIRWGDMDALLHVNNTQYFRYMEQARVEWLDSLGYLADRAQGMPVIVNASCTFMVPLTNPDVVEVRMYGGHAGRSSLPTYYELRSAGAQTLNAEGAAKIVWMNPADGKSIPLPAALRRLVSEHIGHSKFGTAAS